MSAVIIWKPVQDAIDKAMFPYSDQDEWLTLGAWFGRNVYEQHLIYTLELVTGDVPGNDLPGKRALLLKMDGIVPLFTTEDDVADAAAQIGFENYRTEAFDGGREGAWIIPIPPEN